MHLSCPVVSEKLGPTGLTANEKVVCKDSREQEGREWQSEGYCPGNSWRALFLIVFVCAFAVCAQDICLQTPIDEGLLPAVVFPVTNFLRT